MYNGIPIMHLLITKNYGRRNRQLKQGKWVSKNLKLVKMKWYAVTGEMYRFTGTPIKSVVKTQRKKKKSSMQKRFSCMDKRSVNPPGKSFKGGEIRGTKTLNLSCNKNIQEVVARSRAQVYFEQQFSSTRSKYVCRLVKNGKHRPNTCNKATLRDKLRVFASRISQPLYFDRNGK